MARAVDDLIKASIRPITSLFSTPSKPKVPEPKTAPVPDSLTSRMAKQRQAERRYGRTGRAGTVLSQSDTLG